MRASRKAYGSNSFFQSYIKIPYHEQDFCVRNSIAHKYEQFNEKFAAVFVISEVINTVVVKFLKDEVER